eukprot:8361997-Alexandrium_andersonii.AAC.1
MAREVLRLGWPPDKTRLRYRRPRSVQVLNAGHLLLPLLPLKVPGLGLVASDLTDMFLGASR